MYFIVHFKVCGETNIRLNGGFTMFIAQITPDASNSFLSLILCFTERQRETLGRT
jgi:hypothetical protein